jgi:hypothetical protein
MPGISIIGHASRAWAVALVAAGLVLLLIVDACSPELPRSIRVETSPCEGVCPEYVIEVFSNDRFVYEGRSFVVTTGLKEGRFPDGTFAKFAKRLESLRPVGRKTYTSEEDCPGGLASDNSGFKIDWRMESGPQSQLDLNLGCKFPEKRAMMTAISDALQLLPLETYIGTEEERQKHMADWRKPT